jgi:hypothetical protein
MVLVALLAAGFPGALAQEPEEKSKDAVSEELDDLLDEFALLEEETIVESAARHRQDIGMSPSARASWVPVVIASSASERINLSLKTTLAISAIGQASPPPAKIRSGRCGSSWLETRTLRLGGSARR